METSQIRAIVRGRVQGVYFRASTREEAQKLGLRGYAKNLADGSVEVVAEGPEDALKQLVDYLHRGPAHARVDQVQWAEAFGLEAPDPFGVR
ncbi:MAG: acylphosphatase [Candidatus Eisenbacteria bacterium]|uniref:Acylphosphatase n=1 Tax=Eiseniibacteriota bacterium TaxID=2212470 RepID=A0A956NEA8_UNCEI|nr:acylphosphatase [Candidatus Eisenbacteria bacterium]MCB9462420.1 acylphosphatase [Candidatus Eisenbacteria bacterium]